ncbi:MAG: peptidase dimerization domain-containing protein [Armatimonadetes bacterium]|nr:peptidase dimerization domain-containing protein [Armatimonadota bacterium]
MWAFLSIFTPFRRTPTAWSPPGGRAACGSAGAPILRAFGPTAHGSVPWEGVNAIYVMMELLDELSKSLETGDGYPSLGRNSFNVGALHAGERPSRVPDIWRTLESYD